MEKKEINKKTAAATAMAALAMTALMGGTFAYLTDHESVTNTFTAGRVEIEGTEPNWDPDGDGEPGGTAEKIVPAQSWAKNPQIKNTGDTPAYVYMEVAVPVADAVYANSQGIRQNGGNTAHIELFEFDAEGKTAQTLADGVGISEQNDAWTQMYKEEIDGRMVYTFCYDSVLNPEETTASLFDTITFANVVEGQFDGQELEVPVRFYAIQEMNTGDGGASAVEKARNAYDKYLRQNAGKDGAAMNDATAGN